MLRLKARPRASSAKEAIDAARTKPAPIGRHEAAAKELAAAGLLRKEDEGRAAAILQRHFAMAPGQYSFSADTEMVHQSISHHLGSYFQQVMEPTVRSFHTKGSTGRLMKDEDVDKAARVLTVRVAGELGEPYVAYLQKYFGAGEGLASYIFSRVRNLLMQEAMRYNSEFCSAQVRRESARKVLEATAPREEKKQ